MIELPIWAAALAAILLVISGVITLIGSLGLLRFKRFYARMHAPTLGNTLGSMTTLLASIVVASALSQRPVFHEILITLFLVITAPVTATLLMQAAVRRDTDDPMSGDLQ